MDIPKLDGSPPLNQSIDYTNNSNCSVFVSEHWNVEKQISAAEALKQVNKKSNEFQKLILFMSKPCTIKVLLKILDIFSPRGDC